MANLTLHTKGKLRLETHWNRDQGPYGIALRTDDDDSVTVWFEGEHARTNAQLVVDAMEGAKLTTFFYDMFKKEEEEGKANGTA